jgi:hypothetical protein
MRSGARRGAALAANIAKLPELTAQKGG